MAASTGAEHGTTPNRSLSRADVEAVLRFLRQLSVKLKAGLSVEKCLAALSTDTRNRKLRRACQQMRTAMGMGGSLAEAMRGQVQLFDVCVTGLVERGEKSRKLLASLANACDYLEARRDLEDALRSAMARPIHALLLVLLATFAATVALSFLVKEFLPAATASQHASLGIAEHIAVHVSEAVRVAWPFVGVFGLSCFVAFRLLPRYPKTRGWLDALASRLPLVGVAVRATGVAIFARTVGVRMQGGDTLAQAMAIAALTAPSQNVQQQITATVQRIEKGRPYIEALVESGFLRLGDVNTVQGAERRGELGALMLTLARDREREAAADVKTLKAVTHTVVVVLLGLAIMAVVLTLYVPVFIVH